MQTFQNVDCCRVCGGANLERFLDLGETPLANSLVAANQLGQPEARFPLAVLRCSECGLVQLSVVVEPEVLFRDYVYSSSASAPMVAHFDAYADEVVTRFAKPGSLVVEVGSNDGVLLRPFVARGTRAIGVEPATNIANIATDAGLETWNEFFSADVARRIAHAHGRAKAIVANNVLAHIHDLGEVVKALDALLDDDGVFVAEFPYLGDLLDHVEYDTIYHEHLSYFHLSPLERLFSGAGMRIFDVRPTKIHGGSIRVFVCREGRHASTRGLAALQDRERTKQLDFPATYSSFAERVHVSRIALRELISDLRRDGKRVAALGATAKGNTLLNYCGLGVESVEYVADSTPMKHGLFTPGMHLPIRPEATITEDRPDYTLLLAWNYAESIVPRFRSYLESGGHFIHPVPVARVISA